VRFIALFRLAGPVKRLEFRLILSPKAVLSSALPSQLPAPNAQQTVVLQRSMYSSQHAQMPPPQSRSVAPETFLLDQDAQQSLPPDSIVALQQVDNCKHLALCAHASSLFVGVARLLMLMAAPQ
jgi:hypothetical protein